jgi:hypothetical protein
MFIDVSIMETIKYYWKSDRLQQMRYILLYYAHGLKNNTVKINLQIQYSSSKCPSKIVWNWQTDPKVYMKKTQYIKIISKYEGPKLLDT